MKVTRIGARSASRSRRGIGVDDRQPVISVHSLHGGDMSGDKKENQPGKIKVRMGRVKVLQYIRYRKIL